MDKLVDNINAVVYVWEGENCSAGVDVYEIIIIEIYDDHVQQILGLLL